jgi:hypothetical protein
LEKRSKKLLSIGACAAAGAWYCGWMPTPRAKLVVAKSRCARGKVIWFFFPKKNILSLL